MLYPTINQYIDALSDSAQFSRSLAGVQFVTAMASDPVYCSGNFGVVFKVKLNDAILALKCFTKEQNGRAEAYLRLAKELPKSEYLLGFEWLEDELLVAPHGSDVLQSFDALKMEYVEGRTLTFEVEEAAQARDRAKLLKLSESFDKFALWLLDQDFAHGDVKPDNVMVVDGEKLVLVDYDGIYLPSMEGELQREAGTVVFQHPLRSEMMFCKSIDDYSLALICLILRVLAREPELIDKRNSGQDEWLIHPLDAVNGSSSMLDYIEAVQLADNQLINAVKSKVPQIENLKEILTKKADLLVKRSVLHPIQGKCGWGFADERGEILVSPIYEAVQGFRANLAAVCINEKWGYIDEKGGVVVPFLYDRAWDFSDEEKLALVKNGEKYGFVNAKGRLAIKFEFDYAASFCEGLAVAAIDGKYGFIDTKGRWVIAPQYRFARSFHGQLAQVELLDGTVINVDKNNRVQ